MKPRPPQPTPAADRPPLSDYVPFGALDPLTRRTLVYWLAQDTPNDPEMDVLVQRAEDEELDDAARRAAMHAIADLAELRDAADAEKSAAVSLELPGGLRLSAPLPTDASPEQTRRAQQWIWSRVVDGLAKGLATHDPEERRALAVVVDYPPARQDAAPWTPGRARRFYVLLGLHEAWTMATDAWKGRLGGGSGSGTVAAVPAKAGVLGFYQWLRQEAPNCARRALLDAAAEAEATYTGRGRRDLRRPIPEETPIEEDWPTDPETGALLELAAAHPADEDPQPDRTVLRLASALLIWPSDTDRPRRLLMAVWDPELTATMEDAANLATDVLTPEDRRLLAAHCGSDREAAVVTGIPEDQIRVYRRRLSAVLYSKT